MYWPYQINIITVNNSSHAKIQSSTEIMVQVFDDLRENRPKRFQDSDLCSSLKLHPRYKSLPNMPKQLISEGEALQIHFAVLDRFDDTSFTSYLRENRQTAVDICDSIKSSKA